MIGNFNPYGLDPGGKNPGGRPKKVKTTFAPIKTENDGYILPKVEPAVMKKANEDIKNGQFPPALRTTRSPIRSRALQTNTNAEIAEAMAKSKKVKGYNG